MATFYLDMYGGGSDANDGLTPATPKATLNAATALVTAVTDEIRVRGVDSLFTSVGNATWTDKSNNVIMTGDTTASVAVGSYICKTEVWSGTTVPRLYLVASRTYAAGTNLTTIVLRNTTNCYYEGTTETHDTSVLSVAQTIALQDFGRNGKFSGTAASWTRVDTQITGGWNSGYTAQNSYTLCYNTANASNYAVLNNNATRRQYWHLKKFIVFNGNQYVDIYQSYCSFTDCSFVGLAARRFVINSLCFWLIFNNCYFYHASTASNFMDMNTNSIYMNNCYVHNAINRSTLINNTSQYNNTVFAYGNTILMNGLTTSTLNNCRFRFAFTTFSANLSTNVFNNCTWELTASACNLGTATISGGTYTNTTGAFTNTGNITDLTYNATTGAFTNTGNITDLTYNATTGAFRNTGVVTGLSGYTTTSTYTNAGNFIDNYLSGTSVTFASTKTNVPSIISGNTGVNVGINNSYGLFYENTGFDLATSAQLYGGTIIYDSNNDIDKTKFARIADNLSAPYIYQPQNTVWLQQPSGNTIFYNGGFIDLTTDVYTGKTAYSGTSALRLYNTLNHATDSVFRTVDFNVEAGATGYISFWVKGISGDSFIFKFINGDIISNSYGYILTGSTYEEVRANITSSMFTQNGTATLYINTLSELKVDNIGLYSGSTTENIISALPTGVTEILQTKVIRIPDGITTLEYIVVAGGGGGGNNIGGGGGAGGCLYGTINNPKSGVYMAFVGDGGTPSENGENSVFYYDTIISTNGGGAGGDGGEKGSNGGSGGGGGSEYGISGGKAILGNGIEGYGGGYSNNNRGAGGGGRTQLGQQNQAGGAGYTSSITGVAVEYARGGNSWYSSPLSANGTNGTNYRGNGGYGGRSTYLGGNGGSGIIILKLT